MFILCAPGVWAEDYFDPAALELSSPQQKTADLRYFATAGGQLPGTYPVSIWVNGQQASTGNITFVDAGGKLKPVLTTAQLAEYGVNVSAFSAFNRLREGETFTRIEQYIPDASSQFDFSTQRLNLSIPQAAMNVQSRGYVDPARWDEGIPAAFVDYTLSGSQTQQSTNNGHSTFLNLRSGVNLGPWRLRNMSSMQYDTTRRWNTLSTYLQRDITVLKSQLRMGDTYTSGEIFDSVQFRGVQLMSNDDMLPDSQRGFAPVIRGVAHSNAKVTLSQHGYVIYETYVAPGAFAIKDLYPTAQSGDLQITVKESDGSERTFTQPFSSVPFMLREGRLKYSLSAGRYHSGQDQSRSPAFVQSTLFYGLPAEFTLYGGTQLAEDYHAAALGVGHSLGELGSLGADLTLAGTTSPSGKRYSGHSLRAQYQKSFAQLGTSFSLASYRYSSSGFYDLSEATMLESRYGLADTKRSREEISLRQALGAVGNLSLSAYSQDYWHSQRSDKTLHAGFYSAWKGISWGLGYYYTQSSGHSDHDRSWSFNINIPLSGALADTSVSYTTASDNRGYASHQVAMYGSVPKNPNLYYSVQQGYASQGQGSNSAASLDYRGGYGEAQVGYRHDRDSNQLTWGASGSIVAHPHGITLGQSLGDNFAIVRAPGAANVAIQNGSNLHTDWRGYAVVPTLTPYRKNVITLDTESMTSDTDVDQFGATVIPGGGAVVEANYQTHIGNRVLFTLHDGQGLVPFGASAQLADDHTASTGMVADGGKVYLSGIPAEGNLEVRWDDDSVAHRCTLHFRIADSQNTAVKNVDGSCLSQRGL
ncbi:fimbrial biogenesis outer membrane usher protein [Enterobacteriaceae bacterium H4N4]|uniref:Fimbrial biogenesis outer membrane usher protein n=1 Tax=Silvania confinis TaxID=2926470 RepID=A0A9J6QEP7_9ENTR|nr:fimbria/pilus outer membrane usher protein [Silvania confinis]MCU6670975.1 fimbrial biogenesis outer membrane usher protein [Silvania confinis]